MRFDEIVSLIQQQVGTDSISEIGQGQQPWLRFSDAYFLIGMKFLRDEPKLYFDFLNCLSGVDLGNERLEVVYHLTSIPRGHTLVVKQKTSEPLSTEIRSKEFPSKIYAESLPTIPSISHLWKAALWHEREAFDLLGIHFVGHPDLRRILLPDDWQGHPLRKDYQVQETYHNIPVPYPPDREPPIIIE